MQIIITEAQEAKLLNMMLQEEIQSYSHDYSTLNLSLKKYMDSTFKHGKLQPSIDSDGNITRKEVVVQFENGMPVRQMSDRQLAEFLQDTKRDILPKKNRDQYIKTFITKWYYDKINPRTGSFLP